MFVWIWNADNIGTAQQLVDKLNLLGIKDVCLKFHEGQTTGKFRDLFYRYQPVLKAAGIRVGAWGYNYFNGLDQEVAFVNEALKIADYYIFDGESEIEGKQQQAENVLSRVRQANPNASIGYSSFPYIFYHQTFPYEQFDKYCSFASPQIYWGTIGDSVDTGIMKMKNAYTTRGLRLPLYPTIQGYQQPISDYKRFLQYGFSDFGIWSLDCMDSSSVDWLRSLSGSIGSGQPMPTGGNSQGQNSDTGVAGLQNALNSLKVRDGRGNALAVDGINGPLTQAAIRNFQSIVGIQVDGIAGPQTWEVINAILAKPLSSISRKPSREVTRYIQWRVGTSVDGVWGPMTYSAIKKYQSTNGLSGAGWIGQQTWRKLLG